jgi:LysM repeat protein
MRSRQWSLLAVLAFLNYIVLISLFSVVSEGLSMGSGALPTRTPWPSFTPTFMPLPTPFPTPTATRVIVSPPTPLLRLAQGRLTHVVQPGENLPSIAQRYGVPSNAILHLNGVMDPNGVQWGQSLIIPSMSDVIATWTPVTTDTPVPSPTNTSKPRPPTMTPTVTSTPTPKSKQFTGEIVAWHPNCGATGIHRPSQIFDIDGQPLNGLRVRIWYENTYEAFSEVSGIGGDYKPGEYDISLRSGEAGKFKIAVWDWQTGPEAHAMVESEVLDLEFDYDWQECQPERSGHQTVVINWYRHW